MGSKLKATSSWYDSGNGTDDYGFSALSVGRYEDGGFCKVGDYADFWSSTEYSYYDARSVGLYSFSVAAALGYYYKDVAFSVRCIKDSE